jgi:hypothetical protein
MRPFAKVTLVHNSLEPHWLQPTAMRLFGLNRHNSNARLKHRLAQMRAIAETLRRFEVTFKVD